MFDEEARRRQAEALQATEVAQPAIGAASVGLLRLLARFGVQPDMTAGHSYGELVALQAAGVLDTRGLAHLSAYRGKLLRDAAGDRPGAMAALLSGPEEVSELVGKTSAVSIVNFNGPSQTVIAGPREAIDAVLERARRPAGPGASLARGLRLPYTAHGTSPRATGTAGERSPSAGSHHAPCSRILMRLIHPPDPRAIAARLGDHVTSPVRFAQMIQAMHDQGARLFIEVGPVGLLTPLIESILRDRPHLAVACDTARQAQPRRLPAPRWRGWSWPGCRCG